MMEIIKRNNTKSYPLFFPFGSMFDEFFNNQPLMSSTFADVWEEGNNVYVKMALPGVKKEDIKISVEKDRLSISGHTMEKEEEKDKNRKYYYKSMESSFEQSFNLPAEVDDSKVEAEFKDGVLNVTLPKTKALQPKEIEIK